eukprot:gene19031-24851_t
MSYYLTNGVVILAMDFSFAI